MKSNSKILERNHHSLIVAISETELGKVELPNPYVWVEVNTKKPINLDDIFGKLERPSEVESLKYANRINGLMPKFIREDEWYDEETETTYPMIVMERLYPLPIHHFEMPIRREMMAIFEQKVRELHDGLFVHYDLMRPSNVFTRNDLDWMFQNVVQTETGLRLIDAGFGLILTNDNVRDFIEARRRERSEVKVFKQYYFGELVSKPFSWDDFKEMKPSEPTKD